MLIERYKEALGKSNHGGQSLYDHVFWSVEAALRTARLTSVNAGLPLDVRLIGGQVIGLAVLAAAVTIAVARLSLRRQPQPPGEDGPGGS